MIPLELIESLKIELQQFGEILADLFLGRVKIFSDLEYSKIWGINVNKLKIRIRKGASLSGKSLEKLKNNITHFLGEKRLSCLTFIKQVENGDVKPLEFIEKVRWELGRYSNLISTSDREISTILFGNPRYIAFLKQCLKNPNHPQYNPYKKLSIRKLNNFKINLLKIFEDKAKKCISIIENYISNNPHLPEYSHQQYTIKNPHIFVEIDSVKKAYWLGFFCADASLNFRLPNKYEISLEISSKDKSELYKLAKFIGFNKSRIKDRLRFIKGWKYFIVEDVYVEI